ncbi:putative RNA polymerase II transcription factor B subunit 2 [Cryptosporidium felis]|nr:putative RNA polymerase II transcription factor B subunit 2 [Cryptosporidium felis]
MTESSLIEKSYDCSTSLSSWNLLEYIASLSDSNASLIFGNTSCVTELFSSLSELQQQIVSRLMILGSTKNNFLGEKALNIWVLPSKQFELECALRELRSLKIIKATVINSINQKSNSGSVFVQYHLNPIFQNTLTNYVFEGAFNTKFEIPHNIAELNISYISLTNFVRRQWNNILNIIVELSGNINCQNNDILSKKFRVISPDLMKVLDYTNLISWNSNGKINKEKISTNESRGNLDGDFSKYDYKNQLFDGFDQEYRLSDLQEQGIPNIYDSDYHELEYEYYSDDEYLPFNNQEVKSKRINTANTSIKKKQVDNVFEQKLAPNAFRWLLCDTCNQLLMLVKGFIEFIEAESTNENINDLNPVISNLISIILSLSSSKIGQPIIFDDSIDKCIFVRFILFAYDLGLVYIEESVLENYQTRNNKINDHLYQKINVVFATPFSLLTGSDGIKLQNLYSIFKINESTQLKDGSVSAINMLLPSHFYYNQELWNRQYKEVKRNNGLGNYTGMHFAQLEAGIIVQSNFRIYCYTASPLQAKILRHLCQVKVRGPNLISGILTRKGLLSAYSMGISAAQILRFFVSNAHPILLKRHATDGTGIVPVSVESQLKLWEKDRNRLKITGSSIFTDWGSSVKDFQLYNQTVLYARNKNIILYHTKTEDVEIELSSGYLDLQKKLILITRQEYEDDIKAFIRAKKGSQSE